MVNSSKPKTLETSRNWLSSAIAKADELIGSFSGVIIGTLEYAFYCYGKAIANFPFTFIFLCFVLTGICSIGIVKFTLEERPFKLWIPQNSQFIKVMDWKEKHLPSDIRLSMAIYEAENVLDKAVILEMLKLHDTVVNTKTEMASWDTTCAKVPTIATSFFGRRKRDLAYGRNRSLRIHRHRYKRQNDDESEDDAFDFSLLLPRDRYCSFLESMQQQCLENSLLEVFGYDKNYIESLTQEEIIKEVNEQTTSLIYGFPTNFTKYLGKIERNGNGTIIKAGAAIHRWFTKINRTAVEAGSFVNDPGSSLNVDTAGYEWELNFIENVLNYSSQSESVTLYFMGSTSFGTISKNNIQNDTKYLSVGFGIVFIYIMLMLGNFNMVEMRPILSLLGLSCVGLAVGVSYGICSAFNVPYGPVNNILPFLLLGLGVDDMFVVMQSWDNLSPDEKSKSLCERIGMTLRHAGVSITVTSVTDFVAFAIGSTTDLPALRSFCIYAATGIASIYFFQATFFVAWLSLDQRRLEDHRHGLFWCWKIKDWRPNACSRQRFCQRFFGKPYARLFLNLPMKIIILLLTLGIIAVSGWGLANLRQEFNSIWFLPQESYLYKFFIKQKEYYPSSGEGGTIYFGNMSLVNEMPRIEKLITTLRQNNYVSEVNGWYTKYKKYWEKQGYTVPNPNTTEEEFLNQLNQFLHSPSGSPYRTRNFRFSGELLCNEKAPPVIASSIDYRHIKMTASSDKIKAMDSVRETVENMNFTGYARPWSRAYAEWETDKIIVEELYRNMGLALLVVFIVTLILIASISTSILVLICVLFTLVDVGALMHWWGLTIDTVSCIDLVLAIGLCVDYAAHVGHTFMTKTGSRNTRASETIETIGPAVLSGGFSTVLSFIFLSNSGSHVFLTFFKVFFAVSLYGLYHGLIFLPVILSLIGPAPYPTALASSPVRDAIQEKENDVTVTPKEIRKNGFIEKIITDENTSSATELTEEKSSVHEEADLEQEAKDDAEKDSGTQNEDV
ncbi:LOW QUALITY PROTEIN: patched domain-containing protein 3-like [Macrobrachium rosenbergii]|uniref:LOW QUALITY PROTEIN: patched domain-containing protein 3-like n=1 Tax=Macrobrachium rosenbergii TaxID=79674 RepID=UPI0034D5E6E3